MNQSWIRLVAITRRQSMESIKNAAKSEGGEERRHKNSIRRHSQRKKKIKTQLRWLKVKGSELFAVGGEGEKEQRRRESHRSEEVFSLVWLSGGKRRPLNRE